MFNVKEIVIKIIVIKTKLLLFFFFSPPLTIHTYLLTYLICIFFKIFEMMIFESRKFPFLLQKFQQQQQQKRAHAFPHLPKTLK